MTNLESLRSLQKRIREATGYNRLLDLAIAQALLPGRHWTLGHPSHAPANYTLDPHGLGTCVTLMRTVHPGVEWERTVDGKFALRGFRDAPQWSFDADPLANDCLTFLDAIFSAAIAQEEAKEKADA